MPRLKITTQQIAELRQENIGRLLLRAYRQFSDTASLKLHARGHGNLGPAATGLIPHIDLEGTRASALAERAGITKQAVGQLLSELEDAGYITRNQDPQDARAAFVTFTNQGWNLLRDAYEVKLEIEQEFKNTLGHKRFQDLKHALETLVSNPQQN